MTKIIVALDVFSFEDAKNLIDALTPEIEYFKVGSTLHTLCGNQVIRYIAEKGAKTFLDLKFFDIPHQVRGVSKNVAKMGVSMYTLHLLGGVEMLKASLEGVEEAAHAVEELPLTLGVTVLTSMNDTILKNELQIHKTASEMVMHLAKQGYDAGLRGFVCSPHEIKMLKDALDGITLVTPGIRFADGDKGDQKRVMTPRDAAELGADFIVMGRAVTGADDPKAAALRALKELQ